jgi:RNA polymerase sigma-70 factor (ECF subfamily)
MTLLHRIDTLPDELSMLVTYCRRFTRDADVAEDLAQQTLIAAWQHEADLRDPAARRSWLLGIARNTCLMWARREKLERTRWVDPVAGDEQGLEDLVGDDFDIEVELERDALARLLDRALALLPADTRDVLTQRYIQELPHAEMAARLGVTEGAIEGRLHRGKLALRRALSTDLAEDAIAFGLIDRDEAGWERTRIWCPSCGREQVDARLSTTEGRLNIRCPRCSRSDEHLISAKNFRWADAKTYRPAANRVLGAIHAMYRVNAIAGVTPCFGCGASLAIRPSPFDGVFTLCDRCHALDHETWHALTWSLPEAQRFWRANPRMRFVPARSIEVRGVPAVVTAFESLSGSARLEVVSLRDTLEVVQIGGSTEP